MKVIVEDEKLNEAALLFSFSVFFFLLSRVTSEVGWATPKKKKNREKEKKKSNSHTLIPLLLPSLPPPSFQISPILCEKLKGISRQSSVCSSGRLLNHAPARAPGQLSLQGGAHLWGK